MTDSPLLDPASDALFQAFPPVDTAAWESRILEDLRGADYERTMIWRPDPDVRMRPYYRREDLESIAHLRTGRAPAGRRRFAIRQDVSAQSVEAANRRAREALSNGVDALGFDVAPGEAFGAGFSVPDQAAFGKLIRGLPLETLPLHFRGSTTARCLLALWLNEAAHRGIPAARLRGTAAIDPFALALTHGASTEIALRDAALDVLALTELLDGEPGRIRILGISTVPIQAAGGSAVQELGHLLAVVNAYLAGLSDHGVKPSSAWSQLHVTLPLGTGFLLAIAKCRALRILLPQVLHAYAGPEAAPAIPPVHGVASPWAQTRYAPHNNLLRGTTEAMAAMIGGCDSFSISPYDALSGASDEGYRLARNTMLILKHEAFLDRVVDPAGGAYYLEALTDQLARAGWKSFQALEARGGLAEAVRSGWWQGEIAATRARLDEAVATGKRALIGVNQYPDADERRPLGPTDQAASNPDFPAPMAEGVPLGDLRGMFASGLGADAIPPPENRSAPPGIEPLPLARGARAFEALRLEVDERHARTGVAPRAYLLPFGDPAMRTARASFAHTFFAAGGFEILAPEDGSDTDASIEQACAGGAGLVVLCSADEAYPEAAPGLVRRLRAKDPRVRIVIAGNPVEHLDALRAAGIDGFIHRGTDRLQTLAHYLTTLDFLPANET